MKTYQPKQSEVTRDWHLMDAKGKILGRFASEVAKYLTGKHKVNYSNHMDMGDYVVVINAKDIQVSGKKKKQKLYRSHSGYPGGFKETKYAQLSKEQPEKIIEHAVGGMLPDNRLKRGRLRRMKVYKNDKHSYEDKFTK